MQAIRPFVDPWGWLQTLLIPWLVATAPIAGYSLRATVSLLVEELSALWWRGPGSAATVSQTVTSYLFTVVPPPICAEVGLAPIETTAVQIWESCTREGHAGRSRSGRNRR